jgi:ubiquitin-conjugating enzyme E2 I
MAEASGDDGLCRARLAEERRDLARGELPVGFMARPVKLPDGSTELRKWRLGIKPKEGSAYKLPGAGATYAVELDFPTSYPLAPPVARFSPPIFHTNVFKDNGSVCLSLLLEPGHHGGRVSQHWSASVRMRDILLGLQTFLDEPNAASVANAEACEMLSKHGRERYDARVKAEAVRGARTREREREGGRERGREGGRGGER